MLAGAFHPKEVGGASNGQDEVIIWENMSKGLNLTGSEIDAPHLFHEEADVWNPAENAAHRVDDVLELQLAGSHLVEQRQKGVVIVAVQHQNIGWSAGQGARRP